MFISFVLQCISKDVIQSKDAQKRFLTQSISLNFHFDLYFVYNCFKIKKNIKKKISYRKIWTRISCSDNSILPVERCFTLYGQISMIAHTKNCNFYNLETSSTPYHPRVNLIEKFKFCLYFLLIQHLVNKSTRPFFRRHERLKKKTKKTEESSAHFLQSHE